LLESFTTEGAREIIEEMSPDDRAALMDEVPAMVARRLLQLLPLVSGR
jgi:Mg/Co/Ni transporter MgtE